MPTGHYNHSKRRTGQEIHCIVCNTLFYVPKCYFKTKKCCKRECRLKYMANLMKGRKNTWWQKGITPERNKKISLASKGKKKSLSYRKKLKKALKTYYRENPHWSSLPSRKEEVTNILMRAKENQKFRKTKPEILMEKLLENAKIEYFEQLYIKGITHPFVCDFYLPKYNIIIECDGEYWHNYPNGREIDTQRVDEVEKLGYTIYRFWAKDIEQMTDIKKHLRLLK
jgi:very-short-patch-repair endonuclease